MRKPKDLLNVYEITDAFNKFSKYNISKPFGRRKIQSSYPSPMF